VGRAIKPGATVFVAAAALLLAAAAEIAAPARSATRPPLVLRWLQMIDDVDGYALSGLNPDAYRLLRTNDGGRMWVDVTPGGGTIHPSGPITFVGTTTRLFSTKLRKGVFAVERSDDGGRSWQRSLPFKDPHGLGVGQPFAVDARHLYVAIGEGAAAGSEGQSLYASSDGGHSWRFVSRTDVSRVPPRTLPFGCDKNGFGFSTPTRGWAGGYCAGGYPFFYRTDDGGRSWRRQPLAAPAQCACDTSAPRFFTPRVAVLYVLGFTTNGSGKPLLRVFWTSDGGRHWRASDPHSGRASVVSFADSRTAWVLANRPGGIRGPFNRLFRTTDAGRHWQMLKLPFDGANYQLDAASATLAYAFRAVDGSSFILRTEDGGRSWQRIRTVGVGKNAP
jgi:photosystem II stability/assembly factor-like uncharacterized protein